ncbi:hypothetical protein GUO98_004869 [Salmonella enterica]|nr:hypothetical protein [Salmonella enterica]
MRPLPADSPVRRRTAGHAACPDRLQRRRGRRAGHPGRAGGTGRTRACTEKCPTAQSLPGGPGGCPGPSGGHGVPQPVPGGPGNRRPFPVTGAGLRG